MIDDGRSPRQLGRLLSAMFAVMLALACLPAALHAQDSLYTYTVDLLGSIGGSPDAQGSRFGNAGFEAGFSMVTEPETLLGVRVGHLGLGGSKGFEGLSGAGLDYVTVAGEYRFAESYFDSGLYLGLGAYRLNGRLASGKSDNQTQVGITLGSTGDFPINRSLSVLLQISAHYANFHQAQFFAMAQGGIAWHF